MDASEEPSDVFQNIGRLVNHGRKDERNAKVRLLDIEGTPTLCLFATRAIQAQEEILYDYGIPEAQLPWNKTVSKPLQTFL